MRKTSQIYVGVDLAKGPGHSINTEAITLHHPDGTIEILSIHEWKTTIDLPRSSYREKEAEADNFR